MTKRGCSGQSSRSSLSLWAPVAILLAACGGAVDDPDEQADPGSAVADVAGEIIDAPYDADSATSNPTTSAKPVLLRSNGGYVRVDVALSGTVTPSPRAELSSLGCVDRPSRDLTH